MITEDQLTELYSKQLVFTDTLCSEYGPMEVAAIMMAQSLSLYRTALSEEEYNAMVDTISNSRSKVKTFEKVVLQ